METDCLNILTENGSCLVFHDRQYYNFLLLLLIDRDQQIFHLSLSADDDHEQNSIRSKQIYIISLDLHHHSHAYHRRNHFQKTQPYPFLPLYLCLMYDCFILFLVKDDLPDNNKRAI